MQINELRLQLLKNGDIAIKNEGGKLDQLSELMGMFVLGECFYYGFRKETKTPFQTLRNPQVPAYPILFFYKN